MKDSLHIKLMTFKALHHYNFISCKMFSFFCGCLGNSNRNSEGVEERARSRLWTRADTRDLSLFQIETEPDTVLLEPKRECLREDIKLKLRGVNKKIPSYSLTRVPGVFCL